MKSCCQCNRCSVRAASAKGSIIIIFVHALKSGDDDDPAVFQLPADPLGIDPFQSCIAVITGGMHSHLKCIQGYCRHPSLVHGHGHQRHRHLFSNGQQHIQFSFRWLFIDVLCHFDQLIRIFAHCRKHNHYIVAFLVFCYTPVCHMKDPFFICHRCTAKFFNY